MRSLSRREAGLLEPDLALAGVDGCSLYPDEGCADPLGQKALRASTGSVFRVPLVDFEEAPGRRIALVPHDGTPLGEVELGEPVMFVLGAEREGIPDDVLATCDERATIPIAGAESLNVAMAGTIALYERARRRLG